MTNNNSVTSASTASRTTKMIYDEIENVKHLLDQSLRAEKCADKRGAKARRADRKALRSELWQLRDEWDRVAAADRAQSSRKPFTYAAGKEWSLHRVNDVKRHLLARKDARYAKALIALDVAIEFLNEVNEEIV